MRRIAALVLASGVWTATMAAETGVAPGSTVDRIVEENAAARGGVEVYKTVEGLKIPMAIETGTGSGSGLERLVLDRVLLNQDRSATRPSSGCDPVSSGRVLTSHASSASPGKRG